MISIKQYIEYYYNLENINITKIKEYYRLDYKNTNYLFMPLTRYPIEILQINRVINNDANYDNIVLNIKNQLITLGKGKIVNVDNGIKVYDNKEEETMIIEADDGKKYNLDNFVEEK